MQVKTLIISNRNDISIEYLISKMHEKNLSYLRLNSEDLGVFDFDINPKGEYFCFLNTEEYDLNNIESVLFRRAPLKFNLDSNEEDSPYLINERKHFLEGFFLSLDKAKWINPMFATHIAERKLFQLKTAFNLGLKIPKSIVTNNTDKAILFIKSNKETIIKPISNGLQTLKNKTYSIYTSPITIKSFAEIETPRIFETPIFLQEKIDNLADIRVTIVGNQIYAAKITKIDSMEVDWRKPSIKKKYALLELPQNLQKQLLSINQFYGLIYSAIDLILTPKGDYIFLEINPVGEFVWLEKELGLQISNKIIDEIT